MESRRHPARTLALSLILFPLLAFAGPEAAKEPPPDLDKQVRNLRDPDFKVREAASEALAKAGESAREALKKAARSEDLEVSTRAKAILDALDKAILDALDHPPPPPLPPITQSELVAIKHMKTLVDAEANFMFMHAEFGKNGKAFAFNLPKLHEQKDAAGNKIALIPEDLAHGSRGGYRFGDMASYNATQSKNRRFGFAYYAVPETYGKDGTRTFIVNHTGMIYFKNTKGEPPMDWPEDPEKEGWELLRE